MVNASPIGDLSVFFLGLGAEAGIRSSGGNGSGLRHVALKDFFLSYKTLDLKPGEGLEYIEFDLPGGDASVNFEKVCRRTHLDIASVNSAVKIIAEKQGESLFIREIDLSAGGVAPVPLVLGQNGELL